MKSPAPPAGFDSTFHLPQSAFPNLFPLEPARGTPLCSWPLQTALFPSSTLAEFYRFALLLTGNAKSAEQVMADTLTEVESQLSQFRNETSRQAWLATHIRERCLENNKSVPPSAPRLLRDDSDTGSRPEILKIEAFLLAQRFHTLPEPERSALALFYLDLFTAEEVAELLNMDMHTLSDTLGAARDLLQKSLGAMRDESTPPS
ncbi:MAG: sigma-70 family RNA polymerase sigma factor [Chthoniobacter sp.]|uniref:RNA polymerase sigma factor n=1 Tax=Chthoniobacter sp. TaxID=2510640 RepID=UPI0032A60C78